MSERSRLLITPGEPAGIGPELVVKIAQTPQACDIAVIADPTLMCDRAQAMGLPLHINVLEAPFADMNPSAQCINVIPVALSDTSEAGTLNRNNAQYVLDTLKQAADLCLDKQFDAVVTGPVQKSIINDAGIPFSGHTEFFAERSQVDKVVMMLATTGLRVALATTHLPLRDVADAISYDSLHLVLSILIKELHSKFGIAEPRILVAGLNPHAGEGGHLGMEEIDTIIPVLDSFKDQSVKLIGPLPADTLFTPHHLNEADAVLAMYHDQGLPVLKHKGFGKAVNITLGLPFIRTSVDHGTALDLAGKGLADPSSLIEAIQIADELAKNKKSQ